MSRRIGHRVQVPVRFPWTRHPDGTWTAYGYAIKRNPGSFSWRILRDGQHWDAIDTLPDAKAACVRDHERRMRKAAP